LEFGTRVRSPICRAERRINRTGCGQGVECRGSRSFRPLDLGLLDPRLKMRRRNGRGLSPGGRNAAEALAHEVQGGSFASSAAALQGSGLDTLSVTAVPLLP